MNILKQLALGLILIMFAACSGMSAAFQTAISAQNTDDSDMPVFENSLETDHFILKWTNRSSHLRDNLSDPAVVEETSQYLETGYVELFGRKPYTPPGLDKIEVVFRDIESYGLADPPDGPIQFNAQAWMKKPGIRQPTSAHELFHKLQYAYGYRTQWVPRKPFLWFIEGTAVWSEVFVWGRVAVTRNVNEIFEDTELELNEADDMAMPFWIYFVAGNTAIPNNQLMVKLLEKCEILKDEKKALLEVIQEAYGPPDKFFASFERLRTKHRFWSGARSAPYRCILGPDGKDVVDKLEKSQENEANG